MTKDGKRHRGRYRRAAALMAATRAADGRKGGRRTPNGLEASFLL
jgi:hypothetical protein